MTKPMSPDRQCEVCGRPIRRNNTLGICKTDNPACVRARGAKIRRNRGIPPRGERQPCSVPDCPNLSRRRGLCPMHAERAKRTGETGPAGLIIKPRVVDAGDTFGRWTALDAYRRGNAQRVMCQCECGTKRLVVVHSLLYGLSKSCGCLQGYTSRQEHAEEPYARARDVFNRLTLLEDVAYSTDSVRCRCECGTEVSVVAVMVRLGYTRSCGCLRKESVQTHGLSSHPLYKIWSGIIRRTTNPDDGNYPNYGGRGITVCDRWLGPEGLANFIADVGERPDGPGWSLDRVNNDLGYSPDNVQWATAKQQTNNRRTISGLTQQRDDALAEVRELRKALAAARGTLF